MAPSSYDPFEPRHEPARTLYLAFQNEARLRKGRSVEEWIRAERDAVFNAARVYAESNGMRVPTLADVEAAERYAMGSADYGLKWSLGVERAMRETR